MRGETYVQNPSGVWVPLSVDASGRLTTLLTVGGVPPQLDDTDKLAVSLYGKSSAAGDTALFVRSDGKLQSFLEGSAGTVGSVGSSDGKSGTIYLATEAANDLFNGSTWDRQRNNQDVTLLASAARTASVNSSDITNYNGRFLRVDIDVTAVAGSPSLVFTIKAKDALSGVYSTILASAAITGTGHTVLLIGPGLTAAANLVANAPLPRVFRLEVAAGTADSVTYSVAGTLSV